MKNRRASFGLRLIVLLGCGLVTLGSVPPAAAQAPTRVIWSEILWGVSGQVVRVDYAALEPTMDLTRRQEGTCRHEVELEVFDADSQQILASTGATRLVFGSSTLPFAILETRKVLAELSLRLLPANDAEPAEIAAVCRKRASFSLIDADGSLVQMVPMIIVAADAGGGPH